MDVSTGGATRTRPLTSLSVEEVCGLLHSLNLGKYDAGFCALPVDGTVLAAADEEGLKEVLHRFLNSRGPTLP